MNLRTFLKVGWPAVMARKMCNVRTAPFIPNPPEKSPEIFHVAAFWDFKSCPVPKDKSLTDFVHKVRETLFSRRIEYKFYCCLDPTKEKGKTLQELSDAKVTINDCSEEKEFSTILFSCICIYRWNISSSLHSLAIVISGHPQILHVLELTRGIGFRTIWIYPDSIKRRNFFYSAYRFTNDMISIEKLAKGIPERNQEKNKKKQEISTSFSPTVKDQIC